MKKLALNKETVRNLDRNDMQEIHGGAPTRLCTAKGHACLVTPNCPPSLYICP